MQNLEVLGPGRSTSNWNSSEYGNHDEQNVDVEAVALSSITDSVANFGIQQYDGNTKVEFRFGDDSFVVVVGQDESPTWLELIERARDHPTVLGYFDSNTFSQVEPSSFSLIWAESLSGSNSIVIRGGSERSKEKAELRHKDVLILFYVPNVHVCSFDGLRIVVPFMGHWLHVEDAKAESTMVGLPGPSQSQRSPSLPLNNYLLLKENQKQFCKLLMRLSKFMKDELQISSEEFAVSIPFGSWVSTKSKVHARVQLADPGVFWTLMANFEGYLLQGSEDADVKRFRLLANQRNLWNELRFLDYRDWAELDASAVQNEFEMLVRAVRHPVQLPPGFLWDDQGRMQVHHQMQFPLEDMQGAMGSIAPSLKTVAAGFQGLAHRLRARTFHLIIHNYSCSLAFPPVKYMQVLHASGEDPKRWVAAFLDAVQVPERLYSGLLAEGAGLVKCDGKSLAVAVNGSPGSKPALGPNIIESLQERNKIDRRLFVERSADIGVARPVQSAVPSPAPSPPVAVNSRWSQAPTTIKQQPPVHVNTRAKQLQASDPKPASGPAPASLAGSLGSSQRVKRGKSLGLPFKEPSAPPVQQPQTAHASPASYPTFSRQRSDKYVGRGHSVAKFPEPARPPAEEPVLSTDWRKKATGGDWRRQPQQMPPEAQSWRKPASNVGQQWRAPQPGASHGRFFTAPKEEAFQSVTQSDFAMRFNSVQAAEAPEPAVASATKSFAKPAVSAFGDGPNTSRWNSSLDREDRAFGSIAQPSGTSRVPGGRMGGWSEPRSSGEGAHNAFASRFEGHSAFSESSANGPNNSVPGAGYTCRVCGQVGGLPESHWFQQCPAAGQQSGAGSASQSKRPPSVGYTCKLCGVKGGTPGAHWVQQCSQAERVADNGYVGGSEMRGGFSNFWKDSKLLD